MTRAVLTGPSRQALVLASFPTALYLSVGEHHEVLPVVASDALLLPTAARLPAPGRELTWGVEPGDFVTVGQSAIRLPGWGVRLVREWRPARVTAVPALAEPDLLSELAGILSLEASSPELITQASAVCRAARLGDDAAVRAGVGQLLGAGQGLTPSGDDVLCAVLLTLNGIGDPAPIALLGKAVRDRWDSTTSLSASLLDAARQGYAVPAVAALVERVLRGDLAGFREALTSTLAIGHSSGPDLVAGLAGSLRALEPANPLRAHPHSSQTVHSSPTAERPSP